MSWLLIISEQSRCVYDGLCVNKRTKNQPAASKVSYCRVSIRSPLSISSKFFSKEVNETCTNIHTHTDARSANIQWLCVERSGERKNGSRQTYSYTCTTCTHTQRQTDRQTALTEYGDSRLLCIWTATQLMLLAASHLVANDVAFPRRYSRWILDEFAKCVYTKKWQCSRANQTKRYETNQHYTRTRKCRERQSHSLPHKHNVFHAHGLTPLIHTHAAAHTHTSMREIRQHWNS